MYIPSLLLVYVELSFIGSSGPALKSFDHIVRAEEITIRNKSENFNGEIGRFHHIISIISVLPKPKIIHASKLLLVNILR